MSYKVELARSADRELWLLSEPLRSRVFRSVKALGVDPRPAGCKKLAGYKNGWRVREAHTGSFTPSRMYFASSALKV